MVCRFSAALAAAALCLPSRLAFAGAWTLPEGSGQAIVSGLYSTGTSSFDDDRNAFNSGRFEKTTGSFYIEYGLLDGLTLVGNGEFGHERFGGDSYGNPIVKDLGLTARYRIAEKGGSVVSGDLGLHEEGDEAIARPIGLDWSAPELEVGLSAGTGFDLAGYASFVDGRGAYLARPSRGPDEMTIDFTAGLRPVADILLLAKLDSTVSLGGEGGRPSYDYHKAGGSLVYDLNRTWSLEVGGFGTVSARNAIDETGAVSALWYRF